MYQGTYAQSQYLGGVHTRNWKWHHYGLQWQGLEQTIIDKQLEAEEETTGQSQYECRDNAQYNLWVYWCSRDSVCCKFHEFQKYTDVVKSRTALNCKEIKKVTLNKAFYVLIEKVSHWPIFNPKEMYITIGSSSADNFMPL